MEHLLFLNATRRSIMFTGRFLRDVEYLNMNFFEIILWIEWTCDSSNDDTSNEDCSFTLCTRWKTNLEALKMSLINFLGSPHPAGTPRRPITKFWPIKPNAHLENLLPICTNKPLGDIHGLTLDSARYPRHGEGQCAIVLKLGKKDRQPSQLNKSWPCARTSSGTERKNP